MTEITFYQNEAGNYTGFRSEGHAGYAEEGEDIVCAAISALVINTVNAIEALTEDEPDVDADEEEAYIDVSFFETPGKDAQLLLKALVLGLQGIEEDETTSQYIDLIFEEV